ncbi:hypothetical protein D3C78_1496480 [compost metagenome]
MRMMRAGVDQPAPAIVPSRKVMNGNAALEKSMSAQTARSTSRDRGPATAKVAKWSVTLVRCTSRCGHSVCSQRSIQASTRAAPPVVVLIK